MLLSDAIALGRTLALPWEKGNRGGERKCALQLAALAANGYASDWNTNLPKLGDLQQEIPCSCTDGEWTPGLSAERTLPFRRAVMHMFNHHVCTSCDWTLDQLIDWVRSVEPAEPPAEPEGEVPCAAGKEEVKNVVEKETKRTASCTAA